MAIDWTPCKESLPPEKGFYLVTKSKRGVHLGYFSTKQGFWLPTGDHETKDGVNELIIAWMPLPPQYVPESK